MTTYFRCLVSFLILISGSAFCQSSDAKTALQDWLPQDCVHSGSFLHKRQMSDLLRPLESEGKYFYSCDLGLIWSVESPVSEQFIYRNDGDSVRVDEAGVATKLDNRVEKTIAKMLNGIMSSETKELEKQFQVDVRETGVVLYPRQKRLQRHLTALVLSEVDLGPEVRLQLASGDALSFSFREVQNYDNAGKSECEKSGVETKLCALAFEEK